MGADPAQLTHIVKVFLLSLALLASIPPVQAERAYWRQLQEFAAGGEAEAQFVLSLAYRDGWDGTIRPGTLAARWRDLAAELDDPRPGLVLALLQREKEPVPADGSAAVKWRTEAAGRGESYAQVILCELLLEGDGVPADWQHGAEWMAKSAAAGFAPAQLRLGVIYLVGDATMPRNEIEALAWFILAAESGSRAAVEYRDERTALLGREAARLAVLRSRELRKQKPET
jgi:TPR repeat protein